MQHASRETILLIEADASLRRLITLGLYNRGMQVIDVSSPGELPDLKNQIPGLVILDVDGKAVSDHSLLPEIQSHPILSHVPAVVLAWDCFLPEDMQQDSACTQLTCLTKPFDARTLHTTIEDLLTANKVIATSQRQDAISATYTASPSPSIWPLVTASGLLLLIIGLMVQVTLAVVGLLILIVALLLWTLGTKPEPQPIALELREAWRG
jgi:DNA-binding NtrC family response regulator